MKAILLSTSLLGVMTPHSMAASISYEGSFSNAQSHSTNVPKFNPAIGVLDSVTFNLITTASAVVEIESERPIAGPAVADLTCSMTGTFSGLNTSVVLSRSLAASYGADDEVDGPDYTGVDYKNFGVVSESNSNTVGTSTNLAPYIGSGSLGLNVVESQPWTIAGTGDFENRIAPGSAITQWVVVYNFTPVVIPEPGTLLLGGMGLVLASGRRRKQTFARNCRVSA